MGGYSGQDLSSRGAEIVERLDVLRRNAADAFELARDSEDLLQALRDGGYHRTADAFEWKRRVYLRELSIWLREVNDAATVVLAAEDGALRPAAARRGDESSGGRS
jgi:hypothetical protein